MNQIINQEINERKCIWSCTSRIEQTFISGDLDEAERTAIDLLKSLRELKKIEAAKEQGKQLEELIQRLKEQGVSAERVVRVG